MSEAKFLHKGHKIRTFSAEVKSFLILSINRLSIPKDWLTSIQTKQKNSKFEYIIIYYSFCEVIITLM